MKKIGILSDTHGYWDDRYAMHFAECDEIWHAGDIGHYDIIMRLESICPVRAVAGNVDGTEVRRHCAELLVFEIEGVRVLLTHIGGYPGNYDASIRGQIYASPPQLFISGHSHILKVKYDRTLNLLHINPGAAGLQGWHKERTLVRLTVDGSKFSDCEVITLGR